MPISRPRLANDPDRYVRRVKGGKYQARPFADGVRENLGLFPTAGAARQAVLEFWWGRRPARLRWARPVKAAAGVYWVAVVRVPTRGVREGRRVTVPPGRGMETVRVPGRFADAPAAHRAAYAWLAAEVGPLVAWAMASAVLSSGKDMARTGNRAA